MKISPDTGHAPRYPTLAAAIACGAGLALSSCECSTCQGTGYELFLTSGFVVYNPGYQPYKPRKPRVCRTCGGSGTDSWFTQQQPPATADGSENP